MSKHKTDHGRHRPLPRLIKLLFNSAGSAELAGHHRLTLPSSIVRENFAKRCPGSGSSELAELTPATPAP